MYGWFFRHLPGPTWFRVFLCLVIAAFAVAVLFAYVFPWAERFFGLGGAAVVLFDKKKAEGGGRASPPPTVYSLQIVCPSGEVHPKQTAC